MSKTILLSGGLGYIGSHVAIAFLEYGFDVILFDNLDNSSISTFDNILHISNEMSGTPQFFQGDIKSFKDLDNVFANKDYKIDAVVHFAGLKDPSDSIKEPITYYQTNVCGTLNLLEVMVKHQCMNLIFSSSASIYGNTDKLPIDETCPFSPLNPYAHSKSIIEEILRSSCTSTAFNDYLNIISLRYFNPVAYHSSGLLGESTIKPQSNLFPKIVQVLKGDIDILKIYGHDYNTKDGTAIRDFIHIQDLASAHLASARHIFNKSPGYDYFNVGTGLGASVLEVVKEFESASGTSLPIKYVRRRKGDPAQSIACPLKAQHCLGWKSQYSLKQMVVDTLNYHQSSF